MKATRKVKRGNIKPRIYIYIYMHTYRRTVRSKCVVRVEPGRGRTPIVSIIKSILGRLLALLFRLREETMIVVQ